MLNIYITFVASDFKRVMTAIANTKAAVRVRAKNIGYQMGIDYLQLLAKNVYSQKYAGTYSPYHPTYREWKAGLGGDMRFHILGGDFLRSLMVWRDKRGWKAGVPAGVLDSGGKNYTGKGAPTYVAAYARIFEWGGTFKGQVHPPRPVFTPTLVEYRADGAIKRLEEAARILKASWR